MTSIQSAVDEFLLSCEAEGLKQTTIRWYRSILNRYAAYNTGSDELENMTAHDVRLYIKNLRDAGYQPESVDDYTRALHRFWRWSHLEYDIRNPMRSIRYPQKIKVRTPKAVSIETVIAMFHAARLTEAATRDTAILAFALDTGCRAGGICGLLRSDIDLQMRRAMVTEKGDKTRVVPFSKVTAALLTDWMIERNEGVSPFFYSMNTWQALKPNSLYLLFQRIARRAGLHERANPHAWRHRFSISYIQAGGDIYTLSRILGHESVDTTARHYAIFTDQEVSEAHEKYSPINSLGIFKEKQNANDTE